MFDREGAEVLLADACPEVVSAIIESLGHDRNRGFDLKAQLNRVVVPLQQISGQPHAFSFLAYPRPRLSLEQRNSLNLVEEESVAIALPRGLLKIDLDCFRQISWFHIGGMPEVYQALSEKMLELQSPNGM